MHKLAILAGTASATVPIYDAAGHMTELSRTDNGILYNVNAEGTELKVLHLYGTPYERGYAQGQVNADQVVDFTVN